MPGIAGIFCHAGAFPKENIERMAGMMAHTENYRLDSAVFEGFGAGTAVLKHTANGVCEDGEHILCFYGEVFEVRGREALSPFPLQKPEDALEYILKYGFDVIAEFNGAFLLVFYEKRLKRLRVASDRMSIHRLFYYAGERFFAFASEAKALSGMDGFALEPDYAGVAQQLTSWFTFGGRTVFKGVRLLPQGAVLSVEGGHASIERYWDVKRAFKRGKTKSARAYARELYEIMKRAVELRTPEGDVSMGLSGGLDARTILALLPKAGENIHSFTFGAESCGDAVCANMLAEAYNTDQKYLSFTGRDVEDYARSVVWMTDGAAQPDFFSQICMARLKSEKARYEVSSVPGDAVTGKYNAPMALLLTGNRKISTPEARRKLCNTLYKRITMYNVFLSDADIFRPEFSAAVKSEVESDVLSSFETECDGETLADILFQAMIGEINSTRSLPISGGVPGAMLVVRFPFLDYNVLDFFCRLPVRLWAGQKTYLDMIAQHLPKAAAVPHYVTNTPISRKINTSFVYQKLKDYVLRKFGIRQDHVFVSDTYDFVKELYLGEASGYVLGAICKERKLTAELFGNIDPERAGALFEVARNGNERAMKQIGSRFTAAMLSEAFFED